MRDLTGFEGVSKLVVGDGVKRLHEVICCNPHFESPLIASLFYHSVRRHMIHCLICASEPCLIFGLNLIKSGI